MTTSEGSLGERIARIEGQMQHVATKADLAELRAELRAEIHALSWRLIGAVVAVGGIITTAMLAAIRFWA